LLPGVWRAGTSCPPCASWLWISQSTRTLSSAYRELEIRGFLDTHQGTGTFISAQRVEQDDEERRRKLDTIVSDAIARAGGEGFTAKQVLDRLKELLAEQKRRS
jgi:GntR family transcriptional regulator